MALNCSNCNGGDRGGKPPATGGSDALRMRLALLLLPLLAAAPLARAEPDFAAFQARFRAAVARQDAAAVAALTRLPFLFEGRPQDEQGFRRHVWPLLFDAPQRRCLLSSQAVSEGGDRVIFCAPYAFYFDATGGDWRLREFAADGESVD